MSKRQFSQAQIGARSEDRAFCCIFPAIAVIFFLLLVLLAIAGTIAPGIIG